MIIYKIPPRYENAEIDSDIKIDLTKSWYLSGEVGTGKTHFSYAIMRKSLKRNKDKTSLLPIPKIINMAEFAGGLRSELFENRNEMIFNIKEFILLIIDDLGSENQSDFSNDVLFQILNFRYEQMLWTGFTSNYPIGKLPYETRIISRVIGIINNNKHHLDIKDRRISKQ